MITLQEAIESHFYINCGDEGRSLNPEIDRFIIETFAHILIERNIEELAFKNHIDFDALGVKLPDDVEHRDRAFFGLERNIQTKLIEVHGYHRLGNGKVDFRSDNKWYKDFKPFVASLDDKETIEEILR